MTDLPRAPWRHVVVRNALIAGVAIGCGDSGSPTSSNTTTPAAVAAASVTTQTGVAGTAVSVPPGVRVSAANGAPIAGANVTFAVTSGGGSVAGGTRVTDAAGVATAQTWTLGTSTGTNVVTASVGSLPPVTFTAIGTAGPPANITKVATSDNQTAVAATLVPIAPSVVVRDANSNPVQGVAVTFAVTLGGGSVSGATQTTNAAGTATVGSWTLGPAAGPNALSATVVAVPTVTFAATATAPPTVPTHATQDRADEVSGNQLHVIYVLPSDGEDRRLDLTGALANSVGSFQTWLAGQTGGRRLRLDTYQGSADITFFRLARSDATMKSYGAYVRDTIEKDLAQAGHVTAGKVYAAYYDGGSTWSCGGGAWPPALPGRVGAMYLRGTPPGAPGCATNSLAASPTAPPGYFEFGMLHEVLHTLGFVADNAPREHANGHVPEPTDLMYAGTLPWQPTTLDVGRDDYYGSNVPAGVLNFADSPFLLPSSSAAIAPLAPSALAPVSRPCAGRREAPSCR